MTKDVAGRWRVQNEGFGKVKYVEIAKNKQSLRKAQVGHNKIQKQNVKKNNINSQRWRIQSRIAKIWRKIKIYEQRGRV